MMALANMWGAAPQVPVLSWPVMSGNLWNRMLPVRCAGLRTQSDALQSVCLQGSTIRTSRP